MTMTAIVIHTATKQLRTPKWSDEVVNELKSLAEQGMSAAQAAAHFNGMSRSAATGLASRRKFSFQGVSGRNTKYNGRQSAPKSIAPVAEPVCEEARQIMVTFLELKPDGCRWPHGDPLREDFRYCGKQQAVDRSYCPYHTRIAYEPRVR